MEIEKIYQLIDEKFKHKAPSDADVETAIKVANSQINLSNVRLIRDPNYEALVLAFINGQDYGGFYFMDGDCYAIFQYKSILTISYDPGWIINRPNIARDIKNMYWHVTDWKIVSDVEQFLRNIL